MVWGIVAQVMSELLLQMPALTCFFMKLLSPSPKHVCALKERTLSAFVHVPCCVPSSVLLSVWFLDCTPALFPLTSVLGRAHRAWLGKSALPGWPPAGEWLPLPACSTLAPAGMLLSCLHWCGRQSEGLGLVQWQRMKLLLIVVVFSITIMKHLRLDTL